MSATFHIPAMDCPEELTLIRQGLGGLSGVGELHPNYLSRTLTVEFDAARIDAAAITDRLREIGFAPQAGLPGTLPIVTRGPRIGATTIAGAGLLAPAAVLYAIGGDSLAVDLLTAASAIVAGIPVARAAIRAALLRALDMNALMTIAAVGALATRHGFEAATAMLLFNVSLLLERFSMDRARKAVRSLVALEPATAHLLAAGGVEDVDPARLVVGDRVLVRPGERIPVDGDVAAGESGVNQAPITGESVPVEKRPGERVFAGTLNGEGSLEVLVTRLAHESTLAHIARLVEQAQTNRAPTARFVDRFARQYTPIVIALAALIAIGPLVLAQFGVEWVQSAGPLEWIHRGLVLLVIACPCALVIATPVTIVCGLHQAARRGILIKGGEYLERAGTLDTLLFDKTGTLTTGEVRLVEVRPEPPFAADEVLSIAASLEHHSEHPLAAAIIDAAQERGLPLETVDEFSALRGRGLRGNIGGRTALVGSPRLFAESGIAAPVSDAAPGRISILVALDGKAMGRIELADSPRPGAREALAELRGLGVERQYMLTGDSAATGRAVGDAVGIDEVFAELLPEDKVAKVEEVRQRHPRLAMIGDGVNDAPALAAAGLGIALGSQASDTALETADVVVMSPQLSRLGELLRLGRKCRRLLIQNFTLALAIKGAVLALAALGWGTMWLAVAADVGASLLVIANGMRLLEGPPRDVE